MLQLLKQNMEPDKKDHLFFDSVGIPHGYYRTKMMSLLGPLLGEGQRCICLIGGEMPPLGLGTLSSMS